MRQFINLSNAARDTASTVIGSWGVLYKKIRLETDHFIQQTPADVCRPCRPSGHVSSLIWGLKLLCGVQVVCYQS